MAALKGSEDQLVAQMTRRDTPEHAALEARRELMALQRVEQNLHRALGESTNGSQ